MGEVKRTSFSFIFPIWFIISPPFFFYSPSSGKTQNLFCSLRNLLVLVEPEKVATNTHVQRMPTSVCLSGLVVSAELKYVNVPVCVQNFQKPHACCVCQGAGTEDDNSLVVSSTNAEGLSFGV